MRGWVSCKGLFLGKGMFGKHGLLFAGLVALLSFGVFSCERAREIQGKAPTVLEGERPSPVPPPTGLPRLGTTAPESLERARPDGRQVPKPNGNEVFFPSTARSHSGTVYQAYITGDTGVRLLPEFDSRIIEELGAGAPIYVIGISGNRDGLEDGEYWVRIWYGESPGGEPANIGWVLSGSTNIERARVSVSGLEITGTETNALGDRVLHGTYSLRGSPVGFSVLAHRLENQDFYTFAWDHTSGGFHFSNRPGVYLWRGEENGLRHMAYVGGEGATWGFSSWSILTDDFRYLLQDHGTSPPPRGVVVWRLKDGEKILSALHAGINLRGHTIEVVGRSVAHRIEGWSFPENLGDEQAAFANRFIRENPPPEDLGNWVSLVLIYDHNLSTGERTLVGGRYIPIQ